jgi:hypothetical protein
MFQNRREAKTELLQKIRGFLSCHAGADDYLARIVCELNAQGVHTLTGKPWTTKNLWQFLTTNGEILADISAPVEKPEPDTKLEAIWQKDVPPDLLELIEWAMRYKKVGVVPLAIPDSSLLERVERMLDRENLAFSGLVQELLTRWLAKKEHRIPEQRRFPQPPICMSLLRNSGEHVVITMDPSQRKSP